MYKPTLHYAGKPAEGFGWGVCNANLIRELSDQFELVGAEFTPDIVFMPLADHDFNPVSPARGLLNFAYTFFEYELGPNVNANAAKYDVVFCGSTWCADRLRERGVTNTRVLIQGVDQSIFRPMDAVRSSVSAIDGQFRVFSGGKFEWRKGQDIVIAAFKRFVETHPTVQLVCSWENLWFAQLAGAMGNSTHIKFDVPSVGKTQKEFYENLLLHNGLREENFTVLPMMRQRDLARVMALTDVGLFPNRCEGGTNLVLMEYLSCGRPAVANLLTGHADLAGADIYEIAAAYDGRHWASQTIESVVEALERAHDDWAKGRRAPENPKWTWAAAAATIAETIEQWT